jgi:hypothetical protein
VYGLAKLIIECIRRWRGHIGSSRCGREEEEGENNAEN